MASDFENSNQSNFIQQSSEIFSMTHSGIGTGHWYVETVAKVEKTLIGRFLQASSITMI
jgi:hypothetical protein